MPPSFSPTKSSPSSSVDRPCFDLKLGAFGGSFVPPSFSPTKSSPSSLDACFDRLPPTVAVSVVVSAQWPATLYFVSS